MKKFIKFRVNNANQVLIDCDTITKIQTDGADNDIINIVTNVVSHNAASAKVLVYNLTYGTTATGAENATTVNLMMNELVAFRSTSWTNAVLDLSSLTIDGDALSALAFSSIAI
jgi:hypothetical protein